MKRDQLKEEVANLIDEAVPENRELTDEDLGNIEESLNDLGDLVDAADEDSEAD